MTTYALTIALVLLAAMPASAQDTPLADARWAPWLGCWSLIQDDRGSLDAATTGPDDVLVCVLPASEGRGVGMTTFVGGRSVVQQTIVADGASHPVSEPACSGSQRSEWVADRAAALDPCRGRVQRPGRANGFRDHVHDPRADLG